MVTKSEDLREKNFKAFEKKYGFRPRIDPDEDKNYRMGMSKNGLPILFIIGAAGGNDLRMNSEYDPVYEAERWAEKFEFKNRRTTIMLLGFGTAYSLLALEHKTRPDTTFFIFEPNEDLFAYVCAFIDLTGIIENKRVYLHINDAQRGLYVDNLIKDLTTYNSETEAISTPYYAGNEAFDESCVALSAIMAGNRNYQRTRGRASLKCRMYAWNHMRQAYLMPDLGEVLPKGIPAVIVSAGPSLNKNVDVLKKIKGHALIMSSDRALGILDERGIKPDLVLSAEAVKNPVFLDHRIADDVPLLCSYQANSKAQKLYEGRCIYFHALAYDEEVLGEKIGAVKEGLDLGGNVSGACFVACRMMGIRTIILVGQDMAYLDGKHHADNSDSGGDDARNLKTIQLPGVNGEMVDSCGMWREFRDFYERQIKLFPDIRLIDATEGGALIRGSEVMTLEDVAQKVCTKDYNLDSILSKMPKAQDDHEYEIMLGTLDKWKSNLDRIIENSEEIVTICSQLLKVCRYQDIRDKKYRKKLEKLDKLRGETYSYMVNNLLEEFWVEDMYSIPDYTFVVRNNEEAVPVFESAIKYYDHLPEDCRSLKDEISKAVEEGIRDYLKN